MLESVFGPLFEIFPGKSIPAPIASVCVIDPGNTLRPVAVGDADDGFAEIAADAEKKTLKNTRVRKMRCKRFEKPLDLQIEFFIPKRLDLALCSVFQTDDPFEIAGFTIPVRKRIGRSGYDERQPFQSGFADQAYLFVPM